MLIESLQNPRKHTSAEKNAIRNERIIIAGYKCECGCGQSANLQMHHIIVGKHRRELYEAVWSVAMLTDKCHDKGSVKIKMLERAETYLMSRGFTDEQIREVTGKKLHI